MKSVRGASAPSGMQDDRDPDEGKGTSTDIWQ